MKQKTCNNWIMCYNNKAIKNKWRNLNEYQNRKNRK
jgi:hypothetical protein